MAIVVQNPALTKNQKATSHMREMPIAKSQFLQNVSYDPKNLQMTVTMKNGAQYVYSQVNPGVMEDFIKAGSKGEFYSKVVKGQYSASRQITKNIGKAIKK